MDTTRTLAANRRVQLHGKSETHEYGQNPYSLPQRNHTKKRGAHSETTGLKKLMKECE